MPLKTISASNLRNNLASALDALSIEDVLVVTRRGKSEKAIIDLDKLEDLIASSNPGYLKSIKEARDSNEYFKHEEVFGAIS